MLVVWRTETKIPCPPDMQTRARWMSEFRTRPMVLETKSMIPTLTNPRPRQPAGAESFLSGTAAPFFLPFQLPKTTVLDVSSEAKTY